MEIRLNQDVYSHNNSLANQNREEFQRSHTLVINIMSSPGAGKTTLLEKTIQSLSKEYRIAVIEGDLATQKDADRIRSLGAYAVQINTNGGCHLDAKMVEKVLPEFDLEKIDILFIENVGNLVCPSKFDLGETHRIAVLSVPEGNDKILKYPVMFQKTELVVVNKTDLTPYLEFSIEQAIEDLKVINPESRLIPLSAKTNEGMEEWLQWVRSVYQKCSKQ